MLVRLKSPAVSQNTQKGKCEEVVNFSANDREFYGVVFLLLFFSFSQVKWPLQNVLFFIVPRCLMRWSHVHTTGHELKVPLLQTPRFSLQILPNGHAFTCLRLQM